MRQYVYLGGQPIATIDTPEGNVVAQQGASLPAQIARDIGTAFEAWFGNSEQTHWLHANHLGAIEAVTDAQGKLVWQMRYGAFGQIMQAAAAGTQANTVRFELYLRLPGQYEDSETRLYYNGQRYYDPQRGRYLTPDPLGTPDGPNPYAYVRNNPLRYIDPSGLVLFAFDGTENSDPVLHSGEDTFSNVVEFRTRYLSDESKYRYISGVGTVDKSDPVRPIGAPLLDAGVNWSGPVRIARMVEYFGKEADGVDDNIAMDVDIIGFSRGAAEARDFANRIVSNAKNGWYSYKERDAHGIEVIKCQKVNFRFMGLWDTVLSDNWSGYSYKLAIPDEFAYVSQAVALNEYRGHTLPLGRANVLNPHSWGAFPLESITGGTVPSNQTRIELGFIGAHSDIGGGFKENELSKVPLAWMVEQAEKAGVKMDTLSISVPAEPVLHDKSDAIRFGSPMAGSELTNDGQWNNNYDIPSNAVTGTGAEDRQVRYRDGTVTTHRQMTGTGMTYLDTEQFITYDAQRNRSDNITGIVDMDGYRAWLLLHGYDIDYLIVN